MCINVGRVVGRARLATSALVAGAVLAGCGTVSAQTVPGADGRLEVAAGFYPLQYVAAQVGGDRVEVTNLTRAGAEPHDLELTPRQVGEVVRAALVVYEKGFQPAVDEAVAQNRHGPVVEAGRVTGLVGTDPTDPTVDDDPQAAHDGQRDDAAEPLAGDPHFWQDPARLARLGDAVAARLGRIDPGHAATYARNARTLAARLRTLDADYRSGLRTCARRVFVTSHAAFGYLARRYHLRMVAVSGITPDAEPSPSRLREVQDVVRRHGVTIVFSETLLSPKVARTLAADLRVRAAVLDPVEGLASDAGPGADYLSLMRANLRALRRANGCS
jgi:zinc transport system substrate-binding protein